MTSDDFDPKNPDTSARMSDVQLEVFVLFAVAVAGKNARTTERALQTFLSLEKGRTPFAKVSRMMDKGILLKNLKKARLGRYKVLRRAFGDLVSCGLNLRKCSAEDLEAIHGIGPKTARFFLSYSRPDQRYAVLDVHVLKFLAICAHKFGWKGKVPKSTPSGRKYGDLEEVFLRICDKLQTTPTDLDTAIWRAYSGNGGDSDGLDALARGLGEA